MFYNDAWHAINMQENAQIFMSKYENVGGSLVNDIIYFVTGPTDYLPTLKGNDLRRTEDYYKSFRHHALFLLQLRVSGGREIPDIVLSKLRTLARDSDFEVKKDVAPVISYLEMNYDIHKRKYDNGGSLF